MGTRLGSFPTLSVRIWWTSALASFTLAIFCRHRPINTAATCDQLGIPRPSTTLATLCTGDQNRAHMVGQSMSNAHPLFKAEKNLHQVIYALKFCFSSYVVPHVW